jgi:hypothetical protein
MQQFRDIFSKISSTRRDILGFFSFSAGLMFLKACGLKVQRDEKNSRTTQTLSGSDDLLAPPTATSVAEIPSPT